MYGAPNYNIWLWRERESKGKWHLNNMCVVCSDN